MIARIGNATRLSLSIVGTRQCRLAPFTRVRRSPPAFRRRNSVAKYMYIRKSSLISPGAVSAEQICHANVEKVTYGDGSRGFAIRETKKKEREKKEHGQPSVILLNTGMHGMRLLLRVPASSVYEEEDPLLAPPFARSGSYVCMMYGVFANWSTRNETLEQDFLVGLVTQRRIFASAKSERDRLPGNNAFLQNGR